MKRLLIGMLAILPMAVCAAGNLDGTYEVDKTSALVTMAIPMQIYLVVKLPKAKMIMRHAKGEDTMEFGAWADGDKLVLTKPDGKRSDDGLVFYRSLGNQELLECLACQGEGIPSRWLKVAK